MVAGNPPPRDSTEHWNPTMDVITTGSPAEITNRLLAAAPGTRVHFHRGVEATVAVMPYGFEVVGSQPAEFTYGDQLGRAFAAQRAAQFLTQPVTPEPGTLALAFA